jgi:transposase-like protein
MTSITETRFHDEDAAREHIELSRWANGVNCPFCGSLDVMRMAGKTQPGMFLCRDCRDKFSCRTGTLMERSHIPLHKWLLAIHLMATSKKGISAHQMMRNLDFGSYRTAWFLCHRIREAMGATSDHKATGGLGGGKIVEVDETYVGGKAKNQVKRETAPKKAVMSLVERGGRVASFHLTNITAEKVRPLIVTNASRASILNSDESNVYTTVGKEFAAHKSVDHSRKEYAYYDRLSKTTVTINTAENFYSLVKRAIMGTYHSISEAHLHRF